MKTISEACSKGETSYFYSLIKAQPMKHKTLYYLLLSSFLIFSCTSKFDGQNGTKEEFYPVGNGKNLKKTVEYQNGEMNGLFKEFYMNGKPKTEAVYVQGRLHGTRRHYFENGTLKAEENYKHGKRDGLYMYNYKNGKPEVERTFYEGKLHGPYKKYYKNDKLEQDYSYNAGKLDGEIKEYYDNGQLKFIAHYEKGNPGTGLKEFNKDGSVINNDFNISVKEINKLAIDQEYHYIFNISPTKGEYHIYEGKLKNDKFYDPSKYYEEIKYKKGEGYNKRFVVYSGDYKMEDFNLIIVKRTEMGNDMIKTKKIRVSLNNYY